jgi:hypothetical protein
MDEVPEYQAADKSALDPHKEAIAERRRKKWPYHAILDWLKKDHGITVVYSTLWEFCQRRGINKSGISQPKPPSAAGNNHGTNVGPASNGTSPSEPKPLDLLAEAESRLAADEPENPFFKVPHRPLPK